MKITDELVGKRLLYREFPYSKIQEGVIQEISPSKEYVKINGSWYPATRITIIEILGNGKDKTLDILDRYQFGNLR